MKDLVLTTLTREDLHALIIDSVNACLRRHSAERSPAAPSPSSILTITEAAAFVGLAKATLYKFTSTGQIPHSKRGKKLYFERATLEAWLLENRVQPNEADSRAADTLAASIARRRRE
jgi:excisionase family DNA binding protein